VGSNLIKRIGGKKNLPSILFLFLSISLFAQYPNTGNKQRLGFQTTADGLVWRGSISDTASIQPVSNQNAWVILDTVNLKIYSFNFTSNVWNQVGASNPFNQPIDSLFFKTSVPPNNVDTAKMRWDAELGTVVLGMYDQVPNELGFKNFWLVKNQTGSTITKNSLVYASGTVGASGRISVSKFIANGTIDAKYLLGITAHDLSNGEDGYVISFGKIRQVNTDTFAAGAILYPSPTVAGVWTDVEPIAPNIDMPIGFCINSHVNNGTIAIRVASGYSLNELHDVAISSPVEKSSLYYSGGLWRDTTAALLVSDTASMLTNYLRSGVASNTYLPLIGGTLTGPIKRQDNNYDGSPNTFYFNLLNYFARRDNNQGQGQTAQITFTDRPGTFNFPNNVRTSDIYLMTAKNYNGSSLGQFLDTTLSIVANQDGGRIGISNLNPSYKLDVNGTLGVTGATTLTGALNGTTGTFSTSLGIGTSTSPLGTLEVYKSNSGGLGGNIVLNNNGTAVSNSTALIFGDGSSSSIRGAISTTTENLPYNGQMEFKTGLGDYSSLDTRMIIKGNGNIGINNTSPNAKLDVRGSVIINEDSDDFDTRIESNTNANMVFVDAGQDRVGIGTGTPSKTLDVNGEVKIATVTATPTSLLGKDASNVVGEVTTVAQTGLMTRGAWEDSTSLVEGTFSVTHGLGATPVSIIITSAGLESSFERKLLFEVYARNSTTFSVQAWNLDGSAATSKTVKIYWLAIK
jgi:hypothetical protein